MNCVWFPPPRHLFLWEDAEQVEKRLIRPNCESLRDGMGTRHTCCILGSLLEPMADISLNTCAVLLPGRPCLFVIIDWIACQNKNSESCLFSSQSKDYNHLNSMKVFDGKLTLELSTYHHFLGLNALRLHGGISSVTYWASCIPCSSSKKTKWLKSNFISCREHAP